MPLPRTPRSAVLALTVGALTAGGLAVAAPASAVSPDVVISEVYGGGGNTGATYRADFIELSNRGASPVSVTGWSVQYASASGASWSVTPLSGTIAPGGSYLVQEALGSGGTTDLPTPNAVGSIAMSGTNGKVALVTSTAALGCGADCDRAAGVRDLVGYGSANDAESAPTPALSNTTSASRTGQPDSDSNAADFTVGPPSPTTSGVGPDPTPEPDPEPAPLECTTPPEPIGTVQGTTDTSPAAGGTVTVAGTVVGDLQEGGFNGVFVQDGGDGDPATSDAVFVYGVRTPVSLGDRLVVRGAVSEFDGLTELTPTTVLVCGNGPLPAATTLPLPSTEAEREALEGMLVAPAEALTVTDVYALDSYGEVQLAAGGRLVTPTEVAEPGPDAVALAAANAARSILLDDGSTTNHAPFGGTRTAPPYLTVDDPVRVGDTAVLPPVVLNDRFGDHLLEPADGTTAGTGFTPTNPRPAAPDPVGGDLRIGDFNVLNYFVDFPSEFGEDARGATDADELAEQQAKIVGALATMDADVLTLHEIENSAVLTPDTPYRAVETLLAALEQATGHDWEYVRAHEDTDVITNAIVYRTDRVTAVGDPRTPSGAEATAAFANARTPIAQTFRAGDETFSVIANHLKSKGSGSGPNADAGDGQGASNADRVRQAQVVAAFTAEVAAASGDDDVLLTGDFNAYRTEDPLDVLRTAGLTEVYTPGEYSYVFDGASGSLDHVFATASMLPKVTGHTIWDVNAVESYAYQYTGFEGLYDPYPYRASDHNPTLVGVRTAVPATATISDDRPFRGDRVTVTGTGFAPGERVTASLPSRSRGQLGTAVADADGAVSITFSVPVALPAGDQEVLLRGDSGETASTGFQLRTLLQELIDRLLSWWHRG